MTLIKTSLLNSIAVSTRLLTTLFLNKIIAVFVGPAGYAIIGQFMNIVGMATTFAGGVLNTGVTKYTAEYFDDEARQKAVWRTAGTISIAGTVLLSIFVGIFNNELALWGLKRVDLGYVFLWFAGSLLFFVLNNFLLAIMNGKKEVKGYVVVNVIGSVAGASIAALLSLKWGLEGALVAMMINQSLTFLVALTYCRKTSWFSLKVFWGPFNLHIAGNLGKYSLMPITSAIMAPLSQIAIRNHLGSVFGWESAGHWQAVSKISDTYLTLISSSLSLYYLPRLSEIRNPGKLKDEIRSGYRIIIPIVMICSLTIYLSRDIIIKILFSDSFSPMRDLFAWQLTGDVVKIASWLLAYLMIGRAMVKTYIISEIVFNLLFVVLVLVFTALMGLKGAVVAYFVNYLAYLFAMYFIVGRLFVKD